MVLDEAKPLRTQSVRLHELHSIFSLLPEGFSPQVFQQCVRNAPREKLRGLGCSMVLAEMTNPPSLPFSDEHANLQGKHIHDVGRDEFLHALCLDGETTRSQRQSAGILGVHSQPPPCMYRPEEYYTRHRKAIAITISEACRGDHHRPLGRDWCRNYQLPSVSSFLGAAGGNMDSVLKAAMFPT